MDNKIICIFYINSNIITHIKGIIDYLSKDKQFKILICFQEKSELYGKHTVEDIRKIYLNKNNNVNEISLNEFIMSKNKFIFFSSHYKRYLNNLFLIDTIFKNNYVLNVNYAFHIHKQLYNTIYCPSVFKKFYATFHECEENQQDYINFMNSCIENFKDNSQLVGSTKINYLLTNNSVNNKKENDTILFSFRWEEITQNCTYSTYIDYIKEIINQKNKVNFIYRPHVLSKFYDLESIITNNFKIDKSIDYTNIFNESNFFISDISTLLVDYLFYTKKPVILLKGKFSFDVILNSFGKKIIECFYVVNNINELDKIINELLNYNDPKKILREKICNDFNKLNIKAFDNISNFIKEEFNILHSDNFKKEYWNNFYSTNLNINNPSNFCLFIKNFLVENKYDKEINIIDIGCGNGRDLIHFKETFNNIEGLDMSKKTIDNLKSIGIKCHESNMTLFNYSNYDVLYSRFSLHTLTQPEIYKFMNNISHNMKKNSLLCIETRSVTGTEYKNDNIKLVNFKSSIGENHNRLLMSFNFLRNLLLENNFMILFEIDNCGLAIFESDNPYVLRFICKKL